MSDSTVKTMRDALIERIHSRMADDERLFFLSADLGAPALDRLRADFPKRFVNVGIAEQNLVNVATGLALEGFVVYAYAIAAFLAMRAFEQIRTNLALLSEHRKMNVNLVGVGAGVSYDMSGPSHHSLEDLAIIRTLPNMSLICPCDWVTAREFVDYSIETAGAKYIRLDSKALPAVYEGRGTLDWPRGFCELAAGRGVCLVTTGNVTHSALKIAGRFAGDVDRVGVVDVFSLKPIDERALFEVLSRYKCVITVEEAFTNTGGLDSLVSGILRRGDSDIRLRSLGFGDKYIFRADGRADLANMNHFGDDDIVRLIEQNS